MRNSNVSKRDEMFRIKRIQSHKFSTHIKLISTCSTHHGFVQIKIQYFSTPECTPPDAKDAFDNISSPLPSHPIYAYIWNLAYAYTRSP